MARKRILLACPNHWHSPFQVGGHHLARRFARSGWDVAYLSDPISPWHLLRGWTADFRKRFSIYKAGGLDDCQGRLWSYLPAAVMTPHGKLILKSEVVHRHWQHWTFPNVIDKVKRKGFGEVDLLFIDSLSQSFWLDAVAHRRSVYRVADYNPQFEKYAAATRVLEREMARRVDLVIYPSPQLKAYVDDLGAKRSLCLPNGVDYEHFDRGPLPPPPEYQTLRRPIAVYLGVIPRWFHFAWVREAARRLPEMSFVLIGPEQLARQELAGLPNVHLLGCRDYDTVPAYLQHADVGLMPFDIGSDRRSVEALNPQKLYAYLASGLPVVSTEWDAIKNLNSPARLCATADEFVARLGQAATQPGDPTSYRRYAARFDWKRRMDTLLETLDLENVLDHAKPIDRAAGVSA